MESRGELTGNLARAGSTRLVGQFTLELGRDIKMQLVESAHCSHSPFVALVHGRLNVS